MFLPFGLWGSTGNTQYLSQSNMGHCNRFFPFHVGQDCYQTYARTRVERLFFLSFFRKVADVWETDVWEFQAKSGSSGSCRLFLHFLGKIAVRKMSGRTPGSPRHPSSRHPRPSDFLSETQENLQQRPRAGTLLSPARKPGCAQLWWYSLWSWSRS